LREREGEKGKGGRLEGKIGSYSISLYQLKNQPGSKKVREARREYK
jgi:hypothetical protein